MVWLVLLVLVSFVLAGLVAAYVGFVRRGQPVPHAPWLGAWMKKGVESLPTLDNAGSRPHKPAR